jgi:hypothetical protein
LLTIDRGPPSTARRWAEHSASSVRAELILATVLVLIVVSYSAYLALG